MDFPFIKEAFNQLFSKSSCDMYPAVPAEAAPNYRGRICYHPDHCIGCGMCERVCSGNAITRVIEHLPDDQGDKVTLTFNLGSCTFCATCADFCTHHAIEMTGDYHMVATKEEDLLVTGSFIKAPIKKKAPAAPAAPAAGAGECAAAETPAAPAVQPRGDGKPTNDPSKCVYCTLCARKCPTEALTVDRAAKTWTLDEEKCIGCGTCVESCPKNCIVI
jgi:formate hydrogenlyase subunit 6/NADH:ubiquinone oxidoreductase subunit I